MKNMFNKTVFRLAITPLFVCLASSFHVFKPNFDTKTGSAIQWNNTTLSNLKVTNSSSLVPIYRHKADKQRYYYDTQIHNNNGWSEGEVAFYAFTTQKSGTIPIYRHRATDPERYSYDTKINNNYGWGKGEVAFYAYANQAPGTVPIYKHQVKNPYRYFYSTAKNMLGWTFDEVAFYAITTKDWMTAINDEALLSELSLPGTHESMARYGSDISKCQSSSLKGLLNDGIRVFDIRLRYFPYTDDKDPKENVYKGGKTTNFSIHHGPDYQEAFFDSKSINDKDCKIFVLDECIDFLKDHKTECIVLLIKQEKDEQDRRTFFNAFWKIVGNRGEDSKKDSQLGIDTSLFYGGTTVPHLRDVRGKIIFAFVDGDGTQLTSPKCGLYWGNMDFQVECDHVLDKQQSGLDVENHWRDEKDEKWGKIDNHLSKTFTKNKGKCDDAWFITFTSCSTTHWPKTHADYQNPKTQSKLQEKLASDPTKSFFGTGAFQIVA